jgi:hypothetical protein
VIRLVRILGFLFVGVGGIVLLTWVIEPLRFLWPWLRSLPLAVQVGLAAAAVGLVLLLGSMIWERLEEIERDKELREDF